MQLKYLFILLLIPLISAESVKQNDCINIEQTCANCTYLTIVSILYPNTTIAVSNASMTLDGIKGNYTFCLTNTLGEYTVKGSGNPDGYVEPWMIKYTVTPSGFLNMSVFYVIILIVGFGLIILGFGISDGWVTILGSILVIFVGLFTVINGIDFIKDQTTTYAFGIVITFVGGYIGVKSAMETLDIF